MMLLASVAVVGAAAVFVSGDVAVGIPAGAFALFMVHLLGFVAYTRRAPRRPTDNATLVLSPDGTTKGVRFRYSAKPYYWLTVLLLSTALLVLTLAIAFAASGDVGAVVVAIIVGALALLIGWFLVTLLRLAPGEVTVSPDGIFHRGTTFYHFVPWYAVQGVDAVWLGLPALVVKAYPSESTGVRSFMGRLHTGELTYLPFMVVRAYWLGTDPATVYHALAYYQAHPERRPELATPAAVNRISSGQVALAQPDH
jgi:hypothetical protein